MSFFEMLLLGLSLSMDAFSIAICNAIAYPGQAKQAVITAMAFGLAQAAMPLIGYALGSTLESIISAFAPWLAFILLALIGGKMLRDGWLGMKTGARAAPLALSLKILFTQAIATSVDALAVGVSLAALHVNIITAAAIIGVTTFSCCILGAALGSRAGAYLRQYAVMLGGLMLVLIGLKILLTHLFAL